MMKPSKLTTLGYMPRWFIVCIDVALSFFSIILSVLLRFNFETQKINKVFFTRTVFITVGVYFILFFVFRSYKEIIRHTTYHGVQKILLTVASANALLLLSSFLLSNNDIRIISYSITIINFFISFFMLAGSRIAIKQIFETALTVKKDAIVIFGAGAMGLAAAQTIRKDKLSDWRVMAFVDDDASKQKKLIGGVKVYSLDEFSNIINKWSIKRTIIAVNNISLKRRNEVADNFIRHGVKVSILPYHQQWVHDPFKIRRLRDIKIEDLLEREPIKINNEAISTNIKNKTVLITGAAGSIGSEIVKQVATFSPEMLLLCDMAESPLHNIGLFVQENFPNINYQLIIGNITDHNSTEKIFAEYRPNIVFHAAAYKHVPMMENHPQEAILNNINGTRIIADNAVKYNAERFVMVSTDKAVNPTNVMGASKRIAEMYVQSLNHHSNTRFITTRFGNVLDSNGSVIPRFKAQLAKGGPLTVTHPDITRFFMTIPEACQLVLEAGIMGKGGEIFIFDMGESVRIKDLAERMIRLAGLKPQEDIEIRYTGLRPGEKLYEEVLNVLEATTETYHSKIKIAKVRPVQHSVILSDIRMLISTAKNKNDWECVRQMKMIVPEFKSNNSKFEELDTLNIPVLN